MKVRPLGDRVMVKRIRRGRENQGRNYHPGHGKGKASGGQSGCRRAGQARRRQADRARGQSRRQDPVRQVLGKRDQARGAKSISSLGKTTSWAYSRADTNSKNRLSEGG